MLSLTIFAAAAVGIAALRTFLPLTQKSATFGPRLLGGRTRAALEREKTLVLRSIKELEFDHAMGKVSEKDFAEMGARLRARATRLMRQLDAGAGYRSEIEKEIAKRIGEAPPVASAQQRARRRVQRTGPALRCRYVRIVRNEQRYRRAFLQTLRPFDRGAIVSLHVNSQFPTPNSQLGLLGVGLWTLGVCMALAALCRRRVGAGHARPVVDSRPGDPGA